MRKSFWVVSVLSFSLIFADSVLNLGSLHNVAQRLGAPIEYGLYRSGYSLSRFTNFVSGIPHVYRDNLELKGELVNYFALQVKNEQLLRENQVLRKQLKVQSPEDRSNLLAYVLGTDTQRGPTYIIVDKGQQDGVAVNRIAHVGGSLVGRVVETRSYQSVVETIFSPQSGLPVRINTIQGLVRGASGDSLVLTDVLQESNLGEGDLVVTSGVGSLYPPNLIVGRIGRVSTADSQPYKSAEIKPVWQLGQIAVVFIQ